MWIQIRDGGLGADSSCFDEKKALVGCLYPHISVRRNDTIYRVCLEASGLVRRVVKRVSGVIFVFWGECFDPWARPFCQRGRSLGERRAKRKQTTSYPPIFLCLGNEYHLQ